MVKPRSLSRSEISYTHRIPYRFGGSELYRAFYEVFFGGGTVRVGLEWERRRLFANDVDAGKGAPMQPTGEATNRASPTSLACPRRFAARG